MEKFTLENLATTTSLYELLGESEDIMVNSCGNLMIFNGLFYNEVPNNLLLEERAIRDLFSNQSQKYLRPKVITDTIHTIKTVSSKYLNGKCSGTGYLIFDNQVINACTGKPVTEFNPEDTYWAKVNASYTKDASIDKAKAFKQFLVTSLDYGTDEGNLKAKLLLQIIGYCLSDFVNAKQAFFFIGNPDSGKSQILEFLRKVLPGGETTQIPFSDLGNQFSASQLRNSRINLSSEIDEKNFLRLDRIKRLTSNDTGTVDVKHGEAITFESRTRFISASNSLPLPKYSDGTDSMVTRMCFLIFEKSIPKNMQDRNLLNTLLEERDIICSLAVNTLPALIGKGFDFEKPQSSLDYIERYKNAVNPTELFFAECCSKDSSSYIKPNDLYERYKKYCIVNNIDVAISKHTFLSIFEAQYGIIRERCRKGGDKNPTNYYLGIKVD